MSDGARLQIVTLDEDVESPRVHAPADDGLEPGRSPRRRARRGPLVAAAVAAVVALLAGGQWVLDARESAARRAAAEQPWMLLPLHGPVRALWELGVDDQLVGTGPVAGAAVVVRGNDRGWGGGTDDDEKVVAVVGLDARTGVERWSHPFAPLPNGQQPQWLWCDTARDDRHVVCEASRSSSWASASAVVLDAVDGSVTRTLHGDGLTWASSDRGLLVMTPTLEDDVVHRTLALVDVATGDEHWRVDLPDAVRVEVDGGDADYTGVQSIGDRILVSTYAGYWLLDTDGTLLDERSLDVAGWSELSPTGAVLRFGVGGDGGETPIASLDLPGGASVDVDEYLRSDLALDDSVAGLVLTSDASGGASVVARDLTDGGEAWRIPDVGYSATLTDGTIYGSAGGAVAAWSATDGSALWTSDVAGVAFVGTDPHQVIAVTDREVVAVDPDDGRELWRTSLPPLPEPPATGDSWGFGARVWGGRLLVQLTDGRQLVVGAA